MNEIKCPHCKKAFKVDEAGFADILKQVRDREFDQELHERLEAAEKDKTSAVQLAEEKIKNNFQSEAVKKDAEITELISSKQSLLAELQAKQENELTGLKARKDAEIAELKAAKEQEATTMNLTLAQIEAKKNAELAELQAKLEAVESDKESAIKLAEVNTKSELQAAIAKRESEIAELRVEKESLLAKVQAEKEAELTKLQAKLDAAEADKNAEVAALKSDKETEVAKLQAKIEASVTEKTLAVTEAVNKVEQERDELKIKLSSEELDKQRMESTLKEKYETQIKDRDDSIERLKDMKAKLSVKLIGENLEQHCQNEFNNVRNSMFPHAYFEKDNEAVENTKGDYIYRDYESKDGIEIISIMFEMKDEQDTSVNKKTVESHLKKLDEDRRKKGCEYAILVTLLEADNELYNRGIVNVSYKYDKMFVIRPQFFLPMIALLKDASAKSAEDRRQLVAAKNSNIEIENFVENMETWKSGWANNMKNAAKKHSEAIEQIDKAIKDLLKVRDSLTTSDKHLLAAENKIDDLTVKRLTKNAPSVAERLKEQEK